MKYELTPNEILVLKKTAKLITDEEKSAFNELSSATVKECLYTLETKGLLKFKRHATFENGVMQKEDPEATMKAYMYFMK